LEQPLVSIIVPVYNAEQYLPACLSSLKAQTWPRFEALLVNDGSTDGSLALCRAAAEADARFQVFDKPNSGVSDSRNLALDRARGKYLQFVDSDDYLPPCATAVFVSRAESTGADLVISHFYRVSGGRRARQGHIKTDGVMTRQEFARHMMDAPANFYYGVLWNKFYRRSIVEAHRLRFESQVSWCEDFLFNLEYIKYARLIDAVPRPLYCYVKRKGSLVSAIATLRNSIEMKRATFAYYKELYQALDLYDDQKSRVYRYLISAATDGGAGGPAELTGLAEKMRGELERLKEEREERQQLRRLVIPRSALATARRPGAREQVRQKRRRG